MQYKGKLQVWVIIAYFSRATFCLKYLRNSLSYSRRFCAFIGLQFNIACLSLNTCIAWRLEPKPSHGTLANSVDHTETFVVPVNHCFMSLVLQETEPTHRAQRDLSPLVEPEVTSWWFVSTVNYRLIKTEYAHRRTCKNRDRKTGHSSLFVSVEFRDLDGVHIQADYPWDKS